MTTGMPRRTILRTTISRRAILLGLAVCSESVADTFRCSSEYAGVCPRPYNATDQTHQPTISVTIRRSKSRSSAPT